MNDIWNALADPTRRKILELLRKQDLTAGEIASYFNITKPSMSQHLNILKQTNIVDSKKQGQNVIYSINTTVFQDVLSFASQFLKIGEKENEED